MAGFRVIHRSPRRKDIRLRRATSLSLSLLNAILIWAARILALTKIRCWHSRNKLNHLINVSKRQ
jgi:hypothetical protein